MLTILFAIWGCSSDLPEKDLEIDNVITERQRQAVRAQVVQAEKTAQMESAVAAKSVPLPPPKPVPFQGGISAPPKSATTMTVDQTETMDQTDESEPISGGFGK